MAGQAIVFFAIFAVFVLRWLVDEGGGQSFRPRARRPADQPPSRPGNSSPPRAPARRRASSPEPDLLVVDRRIDLLLHTPPRGCGRLGAPTGLLPVDHVGRVSDRDGLGRNLDRSRSAAPSTTTRSSTPCSSARALIRSQFSGVSAPAAVQTKHSVSTKTTSAPAGLTASAIAGPGTPSRSPSAITFLPTSPSASVPERRERALDVHLRYVAREALELLPSRMRIGRGARRRAARGKRRGSRPRSHLTTLTAPRLGLELLDGRHHLEAGHAARHPEVDEDVALARPSP